MVELPSHTGILTDTLKIHVNCVGNLFAAAIKNLNKLIRLPSGCGEQNMLNFVPNIVMLRYLKAIGQLRPDINRKAILYTEKGYQRQLTYRHSDGSFSAFGKSDKTGSTWLTAFVAKSFQQAAAFIDIDEAAIDAALKWLAQKQNADGSFTEIGSISYKSMQGGAGKGVALTAYVLIAFLEHKVNISYIPNNSVIMKTFLVSRDFICNIDSLRYVSMVVVFFLSVVVVGNRSRRPISKKL